MTRHGGEQGQAMVEFTLVAPTLIFMMLGILQLGMLQHAQVLTEYAAFMAARAGIVHNGDPKEMERAAFMALLPTITKVYDGDGTFANVLLKVKAYEELGMKAFFSAEAYRWENNARPGLKGDATAMIAFDDAFKFIKIEVLGPSDAGRYGSFGPHMHPPGAPLPSGEAEFDFDDVTSAAAVDANRLTIRLTYLYVMRIPFANWVIQNIWGASQAGVALLDADASHGLLARHGAPELVEAYKVDQGFARIQAAASDEVAQLQRLNYLGLSVLPLRATWTARMQSNQFKKFLP